MKNYNHIWQFSQEMEIAYRQKKPIVALESTIISHGMPFPHNIETAMAVEQIIRDSGAIPATIGIIAGIIKIGLEKKDLELLATQKVIKASRKDIPYVVAMKENAATTVAATMICAKMAQIPIFVTGGIGGVHREVEKTLDVSADLMELAQTNVAVVCAGAKAILDIAKTLEFLETQGVLVLGYHCSEFPAFYTSQSGYPVDYSITNVENIAQILYTKWQMDLQGGVIIANPPPKKMALEKKRLKMAIDSALKKAQEQNIMGKQITPFLLTEVGKITQGESLKTNIALIKSNAALGAQIAISYRELLNGKGTNIGKNAKY